MYGLLILSCAASTRCTLSIPPALEYLVPLLKDANLLINNLLSLFQIGSTVQWVTSVLSITLRTAKRAVLDILYPYSKLLLSWIMFLFGLLTNNNYIALQALLVSRLYKTIDSKIPRFQGLFKCIIKYR